MGKKGKKGGGGGGRPQQGDQQQQGAPQDFPQLGAGGRGGRGGEGGSGGGRPQEATQDFPPPGAGGNRGGGRGRGRPLQQGEAGASYPPPQQQQQPHQQQQGAPQDFPPPGAGGNRGGGRGRGRPLQQGEAGASYPPPQQQQQPHQQQQGAPQDFPPPGAGGNRGRGRGGRGGGDGGGRPQQGEAGVSYPPPQQQQQRRQQQQDAPQDFPPPGVGRMQQPPGISVGSSPGVHAPGPQLMQQQGPSRGPCGQQQQARPPSESGPRGPPAWGQRAPPPQQISQPPPPVQQQPAAPQPVKAPPSQPQPQPQQAPQPKSAPPGSALAEKMRALSVKSSTFIPPKRKDRVEERKKGKEIIVETNHLNLDIKNKNMVIHHYDVSIDPEKPYRNYRQAVEAVRLKCFKTRFPAFDGKKNLYSYPELPIQTAELVETVIIHDQERDQEKEMTVTIKYANPVSVSTIWEYLRAGTSTATPQEAIQALDIVLRQPANRSELPSGHCRFVTVGRSFFSPPPDRPIMLGNGLDLWYGFFQSAIIGWKPYLNIDVAHKGFPAAENCVEVLRKFVRGNIEDPRLSIQSYELESFVQFIKDLKVVYEIPAKGIKRTYKVTNTSTCPRNNRFEIVNKDTNEKTEMTVENYFSTQYRYTLRYPHLPCLTVGSREKPLALPLELCTIVAGQVTMKKMNDAQTRTMVKEAAVDTERRKYKIVKSIEQIDFNNDPCLREFGLSVDSNFTKVKARIINAPTVEYREKPVVVNKGVWRSEKFFQGAELIQWRVVNANPGVRDNDLRKLATDLINYGRECGMNISNNYRMESVNNPRDLEKYFSSCLKDEVKLAIVILPDRGMTYASIKKIAELQVGILTQCLKSITVTKRLNAATCINILQKINAKLNGVNHHITNSFWPKIFQRPIIVIGADVTHPAPDQVNVPSIAAVAASYDPRAFRYNMIWKLQPPREEVIRDLETIMGEQLRMFYRNTRLKPEAILFYRDGVSEGQFKIILDQELMAIRRACTRLENEYKPPITFIVVQKRHHTRFFPDQRDEDGKNKNVPAGTVVDTEITHPTELDFYLVSHASIQGTARPTKYHLLWDDSNLSEQSLEEITYYLCHLFTRCTRSVSYPAPTYYAHLAAFRARAYTDADRLQLNQLQQEQDKRTVKDSVCKRNPMFFV